MFETVGQIIAQGPVSADLTEPRAYATANRTGEPVRRHSRLAGRCEGTFWRATDRQSVRRIVLAARRYELAGRAGGRRNGPLGHVALEVLDLLANLVSFKTGRLDPSIDTIASKLRRSRNAIWRALRALRAHGFLDWLRRYVPTGHEGRGPQVRQTSNAYRLSLPARAKALLGRLMQSPPVPDDFAHTLAVRAAELETHRKSLPLDQLALFEAGDDPLGQALARLGRSIQERELAKRAESEAR